VPGTALYSYQKGSSEELPFRTDPVVANLCQLLHSAIAAFSAILTSCDSTQEPPGPLSKRQLVGQTGLEQQRYTMIARYTRRFD